MAVQSTLDADAVVFNVKPAYYFKSHVGWHYTRFVWFYVKKQSLIMRNLLYSNIARSLRLMRNRVKKTSVKTAEWSTPTLH